MSWKEDLQLLKLNFFEPSVLPQEQIVKNKNIVESSVLPTEKEKAEYRRLGGSETKEGRTYRREYIKKVEEKPKELSTIPKTIYAEPISEEEATRQKPAWKYSLDFTKSLYNLRNRPGAKYQGIWDEFSRSFQDMSLRGASSLAQTLATASETAIWDKEPIQEFSDKLYKKAMQEKYLPTEGGGWKALVAQSVGNALPFMGLVTAATFAGGPTAGFGVAYSIEGEEAYRSAIATGASEEEAQMERFVVGTINGAIEQLQVTTALKFARRGTISTIKTAAYQKTFNQILKQGKDLTLGTLALAANEGIQEALQENVQIAIPAIQRGVIPTWKEYKQRVISSAAGGAIVGGFLGAGGRIFTGTQSTINILENSKALRLYDQQQNDIDIAKKIDYSITNPEMLENSPTSRQRIDIQKKARQLGYSKEQREDLYNELTAKSWDEFNQIDAQQVIDHLDNQFNELTQFDKINKTGLNDTEQKILKGLSRTNDNFDKLLNFLSDNNPLSENLEIRNFLFDHYKEVAKKIYKRSKNPSKSLISWAMELQPIRNVLYEVEAKTGIKLYNNFKAAVYDSTIGNQSAIETVQNTLKSIGIKRRFSTLSVKQNEYLRWWLHDPTDSVGKSSWENMDEKTRKIGTALKDLYQNEGKYKIGLLRFKLWNEYGKKPQSVKKKNAEDILKNGKKTLAEGNFKDWIMKQNWVARENYYPSVRETQGLVDEIVSSLVPFEILKKSTKLPATIPFEAYSREGKGSPIEGSVIRNTINHFSRINTALLTMDNIVDFWKKLESTNPQQSDIDIMRDYINNILGRGTKQPLPLRWAKKALRTFWRFYFLNPFKGAWFFTRNIFQSPAYGATQLSWKEAALSFKDIIFRKGVLERNRDKELMWESGISERMPVYQQWMLLEESKIRTPTRNFFITMAEDFGQVFIYSDEINRTITWLPIHRAAQRNLENLRSGKINFKQFIHRLKLDTLHTQQQIELINLIEEKSDDEFMRKIAEYKTENIHFRYRTALRSPAEQTLLGRILVGLMVYPRGVFNLTWQNSIKPLYQGLTKGNYGKAYRGLSNLIALIIGAGLARRILYKLTGREAYGLMNTIFGYSPLAPGPSWIYEKLNEFSWVVQEKGMSAATVDEIGSTFGDLAEFIIPVCDAYINEYESENDVKGVTFWNLVKKEMNKQFFNRTGKRYSKTDRDTWQKIAHVLFSGGYEIQKKEKVKYE